MTDLTRRDFLTAAGGTAAGILASGAYRARAADAPPSTRASDTPLYADLLKTWCDGLLKQQITGIGDSSMLGGLLCPACGMVHGRCADAIYPLMHLAHTTGDGKYLDAAVKLQTWSDNVTRPDGSFINDLSLSSWKGITVFAAIALGDALHYHGAMLDRAVRDRWRDRLARAAKFLDGYMTMETGNINYPLTSSLAFTVAGMVLGEQHYLDRGREFAQHALAFFTPNHLLFGENHPQAGTSAKGCRAVDLGYNVEESLPALALYAMQTKDQPVLDAVVASLKAHMEFMLPDGAWDNSWGTRNFKWTWWGSRTSDGCFPAYALLADHDPRFAEAARRNLSLMQSCTHEGLLHGGPHLHVNGDRPCVHHTFTHAKALATVLDAGGPIAVAAGTALPRDQVYGVKLFDEIKTRLVAVGPWRATVTDYDVVYYKALVGGHATGGALSLLYHTALGPICVASMTEYSMVEASNQQQHGDYVVMPLAPRIELQVGKATYTSLSDNSATVSGMDEPAMQFTASGRLLAADGEPPAGNAKYRLTYRFRGESVAIGVVVEGASGARFVLPVVSPQTEATRRIDPATVQIEKPAGVLVVKTNAKGGLNMLPQRVFNLVPGMQCVVCTADLEVGSETNFDISVV